MLIGRKQLIAAAALLALFLVPKETQAGGGYTPCMVQPAFIKPLVSKPLYVQGEIIPPTLAKADALKWAIEQPDFEMPALVQPVITEPRYDGCAEQATRKLGDLQKTLWKIEGKVPLTPPSTAASRIMRQVVDDCCGNTAGGR